MPAVESTLSQVSRKPSRKLTSGERQAIIAACAVPGAVKQDIAKEYGIVPETISRMLREVKNVQSPSNPLADDYKSTLKNKAIKAVKSGLDWDDDPYKRANIGVKVLEGIGEFVGSQKLDVSGDVQLVVSWGQVDAIDSAIDITPEAEPVHKVESLPESTDVTESTS